MRNPNRVGGRRLALQHHGQDNNPHHPEPSPHNHRNREIEQEKLNQKGEGGRNSEKQRDRAATMEEAGKRKNLVRELVSGEANSFEELKRKKNGIELKEGN